MKTSTQAAYDADFALWAEQQAVAIAADAWQTVDAANVAEEIALALRRANRCVVRDYPDLAPYAGNLADLRAQVFAIIEAA